MHCTTTVFALLICMLPTLSWAQSIAIEELPVRSTLPELMRLNDGRNVKTLHQWKQRRAELKSVLMHYQYGSMPPRPDSVRAIDSKRGEYEHGPGLVESLTLVIESREQLRPLRMRMLMFSPDGTTRRPPYPVIIREEGTLDGHDFVPTLLEHGYVYIEYARHDLDPDQKATVGSAQQAYPSDDWATLAVWAWGGMRVVDYLESRCDVDMKRIAITGHSRGGKMALLAGALDDRIALVVPVQSGAGGAGCYTMLGPGGESLAMNDKPYWYADRIQMFIGHADRLPFDQHFLKALVAPRTLLCIESVDDDYANPLGTQLTTIAAQPAFELDGSTSKIRNGLTYRNGSHSFNAADWQRLLEFAEWHFRDRPPADPSVYLARPYDLPSGWYRPKDDKMLKKGVEQQRVASDSQAAIGPAGYALIGDAGNDHAENYFGMGRFGSVDYSFEIGRRQVTNREYAQFLNAVESNSAFTVRLHDPDMQIKYRQRNGRRRFIVADDQADRAVTHVSWFDAIRYCNWLNNGQPRGPVGVATTESGAYWIKADGTIGPRQTNARYVLPNDHEWYKTAYYDGNGGYRLYRRDAKQELEVVAYDPTAVSKDGVAGLYDRLWEWNENRVNGLFRAIRSGAWFVGNNRQAAGRLYATPSLRLSNVGFRVVRLRPKDD